MASSGQPRTAGPEKAATETHGGEKPRRGFSRDAEGPNTTHRGPKKRRASVSACSRGKPGQTQAVRQENQRQEPRTGKTPRQPAQRPAQTPSRYLRVAVPAPKCTLLKTHQDCKLYQGAPVAQPAQWADKTTETTVYCHIGNKVKARNRMHQQSAACN